MVNLFKRIQKKKAVVFSTLFVVLLFSILEIVLAFKGEIFLGLSILIGVLGIGGALLLQWSCFRERKFLVKRLVDCLVEKKMQTLDRFSLNKLLKEDFSIYLRKSYMLIPRDLGNRNELARIEKLSNFIDKYKIYVDLNLLNEFSKEILNENKALKISVKELTVDVTLFLLPMSLVFLPIFKTTEMFPVVLCVMRVFAWIFYFKQYRDSGFEKLNLNKIEHFLIGNFDAEEIRSSVRLSLDKLEEDKNDNVFFLIDSSRKNEIEKYIRMKTLEDQKFKNWSLISVENSIYKNKVKTSEAFILFPSEMLFPVEEMQEFIRAFDRVIIVDSSPAYASLESSVFYLDQNQEIKKVYLNKNIDRLSGDKGLILRNFKQNNLDLFLTQVEKRIISKEFFYLIYENVGESFSLEKNFIYPQGLKMVSISKTLKGVGSDYYCDLSSGGYNEKIQRAKSFIANCAYHRIYSDVMVEKKLKNLFRAS